MDQEEPKNTLAKVSGKITTADGTESEFHILPGTGWMQWGGDGRAVYAERVDVLDAMEEALAPLWADAETLDAMDRQDNTQEDEA